MTDLLDIHTEWAWKHIFQRYISHGEYLYYALVCKRWRKMLLEIGYPAKTHPFPGYASRIRMIQQYVGDDLIKPFVQSIFSSGDVPDFLFLLEASKTQHLLWFLPSSVGNFIVRTQCTLPEILKTYSLSIVVPPNSSLRVIDAYCALIGRDHVYKHLMDSIKTGISIGFDPFLWVVIEEKRKGGNGVRLFYSQLGWGYVHPVIVQQKIPIDEDMAKMFTFAQRQRGRRISCNTLRHFVQHSVLSAQAWNDEISDDGISFTINSIVNDPDYSDIKEWEQLLRPRRIWKDHREKFLGELILRAYSEASETHTSEVILTRYYRIWIWAVDHMLQLTSSTEFRVHVYSNFLKFVQTNNPNSGGIWLEFKKWCDNSNVELVNGTDMDATIASKSYSSVLKSSLCESDKLMMVRWLKEKRVAFSIHVLFWLNPWYNYYHTKKQYQERLIKQILDVFEIQCNEGLMVNILNKYSYTPSGKINGLELCIDRPDLLRSRTLLKEAFNNGFFDLVEYAIKEVKAYNYRDLLRYCDRPCNRRCYLSECIIQGKLDILVDLKPHRPKPWKCIPLLEHARLGMFNVSPEHRVQCVKLIYSAHTCPRYFWVEIFQSFIRSGDVKLSGALLESLKSNRRRRYLGLIDWSILHQSLNVRGQWSMINWIRKVRIDNKI